MSTAMNFGSKSFQPRPPDKGSFPLDHFGECRSFKEKFMKCLRDNKFENALCRKESKAYLECRMERFGSCCPVVKVSEPSLMKMLTEPKDLKRTQHTQVAAPAGSCSGVGLPGSPEKLLACQVKDQQKGPVFSPNLTQEVSCLLSMCPCLAQHSWRLASPEAC
ncbi:cytochrome c oxidase assembly protein COX19 isoform X1 [Mustela putorius furo]|uniref:Cytochrome c oxidase assembly protein COX19 n=1 Tax=Mustela putorius furo TaxID=9669 RepID=A0A8U0TAN0_MUSPF|nr:cytochrome c oxidase assembly protein COX19 isoform X1 [Mustela putorius furo]